MNVIRHDYVTTNGDVEVAGTLGISYKSRLDITARQKWLPQVGAKGHKIERAHVKEATEARGTATETLLHAETCSHGPVSRPIITSHSSRSSKRPAGPWLQRLQFYLTRGRSLPRLRL